MLPQATEARPSARSTDSSIVVVVVLPLVPVTASQRRRGPNTSARSQRQASSTSPHTGSPAAAAATSSGAVGRKPGTVTTRSTPAGGSCRSSAVCAPSAATAPSSAGLPSLTVQRAPRRVRARTTDVPVTLAPATSTWAPRSSVTCTPQPPTAESHSL